MQPSIFPIFLFTACVIGLAIALLIVANIFNPVRPGRVKGMPYESGMDPVHDTRRRFDIRFHLLAIAFMVFDVELLFLYPWAVAMHPAAETVPSATSIAAQGKVQPKMSSASKSIAQAKSETVAKKPIPSFDAAVGQGWIESRNMIFIGAMLFIVLLALGFVYDWRKGVFNWK
jgi:NADH-quinone oxidoreductase subunit A